MFIKLFYENVSVNIYQFSENDSSFFHQVWFVIDLSVNWLLMLLSVRLQVEVITSTSRVHHPTIHPVFACVLENDFSEIPKA